MSGPGNRTGNPSTVQTSQWSCVLQTIITILIIIFNAVGNVSVFFAICRIRRLQRHVINILVASLAVSDLLVIGQMVFYLVLLFDSAAADRACFVFSSFLVILLYTSILHLAAVSGDRYVAVLNPLRYHSIVTARRVKMVVAVVWFLPFFSIVIVSLLMGNADGSAFRSNFFGCTAHWVRSSTQHQGHLIFNMTVFVAVPFSLMIFSYVRIAWVSFFQSRRVMPAIHVNDESQAVAETLRKRKKELKWAKTLAMVVGAFSITYLPICALTIIRVKRGPDYFPDWLTNAARMVLFLNSALNPLIYSFRSREFREAFLRLLGCQRSISPAVLQASVTAGRSEILNRGTASTQLRSLDTGLCQG